METIRVTSEEDVRAAAQAAIAAGAVEAYNDCVGGSLTDPPDASAECLQALQIFRTVSREHHRQVYGPMLREYYSRPE